MFQVRLRFHFVFKLVSIENLLTKLTHRQRIKSDGVLRSKRCEALTSKNQILQRFDWTCDRIFFWNYNYLSLDFNVSAAECFPSKCVFLFLKLKYSLSRNLFQAAGIRNWRWLGDTGWGCSQRQDDYCGQQESSADINSNLSKFTIGAFAFSDVRSFVHNSRWHFFSTGVVFSNRNSRLEYFSAAISGHWCYDLRLSTRKTLCESF